ncbi:hypothetical protein HPB50_011656 [Hyalomma asiaticum]|uniref:Uncharacterized protein n=1 Tax=Hyalomma asiaticum TaxID=266040 RepID=A0ACB7SMQ0_HYAAI|nr:hypothetical protein HPB50_011656 [Hyalomma asiaticum]
MSAVKYEASPPFDSAALTGRQISFVQAAGALRQAAATRRTSLARRASEPPAARKAKVVSARDGSNGTCLGYAFQRCQLEAMRVSRVLSSDAASFANSPTPRNFSNMAEAVSFLAFMVLMSHKLQRTAFHASKGVTACAAQETLCFRRRTGKREVIDGRAGAMKQSPVMPGALYRAVGRRTDAAPDSAVKASDPGPEMRRALVVLSTSFTFPAAALCALIFQIRIRCCRGA